MNDDCPISCTYDCCLNRGGGQKVSLEAAKTTPDDPPWDSADRDRTVRNRIKRMAKERRL